MSPARRSTSTAVFALFCREGGATLRPEVVCGYRQRRQLGGSGFLLQSFQLDAAIGHSMLQALRLQAALDLAGHQDFLEALGRRHGVHALDEAVHAGSEVVGADEESGPEREEEMADRKGTRLNSSH